MAKKVRLLAGVLIAVTLVFWSTTEVYGIWAVEIESKTVAANETNISVAIRAYWDLDMSALVVPVVIRSLSGGAFWTPPLPVDTVGGSPVGVTWNWAEPVKKVQVGVPTGMCDAEGDVGYDGISPDHICIFTGAAPGTGEPAEPDGRDVLYLTINANGNAGNFEFDTACFTTTFGKIHMTDADFIPAEHGPGTGDFDHFTKGIITIAAEPAEYDIPWLSINGGGDDESSASYRVMYSVGQRVAGTGTSTNYDVRLGYWYGATGGGGSGDCNCGIKGNMNNDAGTNPIDVVYLVNYVYKGLDGRIYPPDWNCPYDLGNLNCDAGINPVDVVYIVNYVYKGLDAICDGCGP